MTDLLHFLLAMGVVVAPMGLAGWLLARGERRPRDAERETSR